MHLITSASLIENVVNSNVNEILSECCLKKIWAFGARLRRTHYIYISYLRIRKAIEYRAIKIENDKEADVISVLPRRNIIFKQSSEQVKKGQMEMYFKREWMGLERPRERKHGKNIHFNYNTPVDKTKEIEENEGKIIYNSLSFCKVVYAGHIEGIVILVMKQTI